MEQPTLTSTWDGSAVFNLCHYCDFQYQEYFTKDFYCFRMFDTTTLQLSPLLNKTNMNTVIENTVGKQYSLNVQN